MDKNLKIRNAYFDALMNYYLEVHNVELNYSDLIDCLEVIRKNPGKYKYKRPRSANLKFNESGKLREHLYILKEIENNTNLLTRIIKNRSVINKVNPLAGFQKV